ncbi:uncharacterized protein C2845_PM16G00320 [Panicum miliaceum]|uniref:Uncharacterized protein n=1 Tax=Panicum miliaceum TaxID=4540 RepID=A0A3L6PVV1_PANMI|nr:uncharacterized protein C2845_PM16G00320 [Panicum miliaceum]
MREGTSNREAPVRMADMDPQVFRALLAFLYTDVLPDDIPGQGEEEEEEAAAMAQHLLVAADRYDLKRLKLICEKLCKHIDTGSLATILALAEQHNCWGLKKACFRFISSPSTLNDNKEKINEEMKLKNMRKVLRLNTPTPLNTGSLYSDDEDSDFVPASDDESLLFSNTDSYIRLEDVRNTEDLENIGTRNWCKVVVDSLSKAARLYKRDFQEKGINAPITGCGIFLTLDRRRDVPSGTTKYGNLKLRSVIDTYYSLPQQHPTAARAVAPAAAPAPQVDHGSSAAAGTSAHGAGTSHDPGGHAASNLQPPTTYHYPSFSASFGQSIADVVGRSRKSEALKILKAFDGSTNQAQSFMAKAVKYTTRANELMAKAHHECFSAMQKLLVDARADKIAANDDRKRARPRNKQTTEMETGSRSAYPDQNKEAAGDVLGDAHTHEHVTAGHTPHKADATDLAEDRDVVNETNKEPAGDVLGDTHNQGHAIANDTSRSTDTREPAEGRDVGNKTTEIEQETQNKEANGAAIGDVPNLRTSASAGTSDEEKQLEAVRKKAEAGKEEPKKQKQQKGKVAGKNMRAKLQLTKDNQVLRDEHEKRLV